MDIHQIVLEAKLGRARKDAQIDTCEVFACALYDVLTERGISCEVYTASFYHSVFKTAEWHHGVVKVEDRYFDSMGEFSPEIAGRRLKIHPKVSFRIEFKADVPGFESEFEELHKFYVQKLSKAFDSVLAVEYEKQNSGPRI